MNAQLESPIKRCNADGAENADPTQGINIMIHSTLVKSNPEAAFVAGYSAYPFSFKTGYHAAQRWLSIESPPLSLLDFRDSRWREFDCGHMCDMRERQAFNEGFSRALAEHIAGGARHG